MPKAFPVLVAVGFTLLCAGPADARQYSLKPVRADRHLLTFKLGQLPRGRITRARLTLGRRSRPVSVRRLRAAIRRGHLRVRRISRGRRKPERFVVVIVPAPAPAPVDTPTTPAPTATPELAPATNPNPLTAPALPAPANPLTVKSTLRAAGSASLSDADADAAAKVRRAAWEPRPQNGAAARRVPTAGELASYLGTSSGWTCNGSRKLVTGNFTGTTDEVIQWAAWKWGLDEDALRAVAVIESGWKQDAHGDVGRGESWGLFQVKQSVHTGTYPLSLVSAAFNADYYGMVLRYYFDGCASWLDSVEHGQSYASGDFWGSVGAWYAGRWHTTSADAYAASVSKTLSERPWDQAGF